MTPESFVSAVSDPLQLIGALHYFDPEAQVKAEALGIDMFRFYFAGRAGVLGPVSSELVQSAFGYFNPAIVDKMWTSSKERCDVTEAATAQLDVAYHLGETRLGGITGLEEAAEGLGKLVANVDVGALPLFAAFRRQPVPESPEHSFMHHAILYRELRGSVHLAAVAAAGCPTRAAHQIKRPDDFEMFGYREPFEVTEEDRARYEKVEPLTDATMTTHSANALTDDERAQIATTVELAHAAVAAG